MSLTIERELGIIITTLEQMKADSEKRNEKQDLTLKIVEELQRDMSEVKPITEQFTRWRLVGTGILLTVGFLGTVIGVSMTTLADKFRLLLKWAIS